MKLHKCLPLHPSRHHPDSRPNLTVVCLFLEASKHGTQIPLRYFMVKVFQKQYLRKGSVECLLTILDYTSDPCHTIMIKRVRTLKYLVRNPWPVVSESR